MVPRIKTINNAEGKSRRKPLIIMLRLILEAMAISLRLGAAVRVLLRWLATTYLISPLEPGARRPGSYEGNFPDAAYLRCSTFGWYCTCLSAHGMHQLVYQTHTDAEAHLSDQCTGKIPAGRRGQS